jgi:hypothetical protein
MTRSLNSYRILQLLPAVGWCAQFRDATGAVFGTPLVCWALLQTRSLSGPERGTDFSPPWPADGTGTDNEVVGMWAAEDGRWVEPADEIGDFLGYAPCDQRELEHAHPEVPAAATVP